MLNFWDLFLTQLNSAAFISTLSLVWVQTASLHQQSGLGMFKWRHVWALLGGEAFKYCFSLGLLGPRLTVNHIKMKEKKKAFIRRCPERSE